MCFWCSAVQVIRYHLKLTLTMMCRNHTTPGTIIFMKRKILRHVERSKSLRVDHRLNFVER